MLLDRLFFCTVARTIYTRKQAGGTGMLQNSARWYPPVQSLFFLLADLKKKSGTCMPHSPNYPRCNRCCVKICNKNKGQRERCNWLSSTLTGTHQSFTLACKTCCEGSRNEVFTRLYIRIFSPEKAFTRSQCGRFLLISNYFKCEGLGFQAFTPLALTNLL